VIGDELLDEEVAIFVGATVKVEGLELRHENLRRDVLTASEEERVLRL